MAGIYGSGANFNRGINVGGLNQTGNTRKMQSTKQNEVQELKLNLNQADGYVKTRDAQEAKKEDDEPKQGGDGAKKGFWGRFKDKMDELHKDADAMNQNGPNGGHGQDIVFLCTAFIYACGVDF